MNYFWFLGKRLRKNVVVLILPFVLCAIIIGLYGYNAYQYKKKLFGTQLDASYTSYVSYMAHDFMPLGEDDIDVDNESTDFKDYASANAYQVRMYQMIQEALEKKDIDTVLRLQIKYYESTSIAEAKEQADFFKALLKGHTLPEKMEEKHVFETRSGVTFFVEWSLKWANLIFGVCICYLLTILFGLDFQDNMDIAYTFPISRKKLDGQRWLLALGVLGLYFLVVFLIPILIGTCFYGFGSLHYPFFIDGKWVSFIHIVIPWLLLSVVSLLWQCVFALKMHSYVKQKKLLFVVLLLVFVGLPLLLKYLTALHSITKFLPMTYFFTMQSIFAGNASWLGIVVLLVSLMPLFVIGGKGHA